MRSVISKSDTKTDIPTVKLGQVGGPNGGVYCPLSNRIDVDRHQSTLVLAGQRRRGGVRVSQWETLGLEVSEKGDGKEIAKITGGKLTATRLPSACAKSATLASSFGSLNNLASASSSSSILFGFVPPTLASSGAPGFELGDGVEDLGLGVGRTRSTWFNLPGALRIEENMY